MTQPIYFSPNSSNQQQFLRQANPEQSQHTPQQPVIVNNLNPGCTSNIQPNNHSNHNSKVQSKQQQQANSQGQQEENPSNNNHGGKRKIRRKKLDEDGRNFTCICGKSYLSYPALYTHVKTKHNGQLSLLTDPQSRFNNPLNNSSKVQNQFQNVNGFITTTALSTMNSHNNYPPSSTNNKPTPNYQNQNICHQYNASKPYQKPYQHHHSNNKSNNQLQEEIANIQKLKQFIFKQFIKDKSKQTLTEIRNSLTFKEEEINYVYRIIKAVEGGQQSNGTLSLNINLYQFRGDRKDGLNTQTIKKENQNQLKFHPKQQQNINPNNLSGQFISPLKNCFLNSSGQSNNNSNKTQKKGFSSYLRLAHQNVLVSKQGKDEQFLIDEVFGIFLSQNYRASSHAYYNCQTVNVMITYFICRIKQYFQTIKKIKTQQKSAQTLIQVSNDLVGYFIELKTNQYLRQPVAICKIMFYFYRWLFVAKFTNKFVKFNQVGGTNRIN